ncbi:hypothetical protein SEMRO_1834_G300490.1 [Seminavis robusta]|uniref:Uncharacterized protein n=1 Tax=Seminavis robusta TaxID=568900 RepID=A0A9N8HUK4_9STRA|nr:hypothetical protein SEMRO_1834_G300490.1 [Seminavis robusta]|eukprot:Sro1834_g300490.1 n/a (157) ;mRNA; f:2168-2638
MSDSTLHALHVREADRIEKLRKEKTTASKRMRMERIYSKLKEYHAKVKEDIAKGRNYESGQRMKKNGDGHGEEVAICKVCGMRGHKTKRSKQCRYYGKDVPATPLDRGETTNESESTLSEEHVLSETLDMIDAVSIADSETDYERTALANLLEDSN